MLNLDNDINSLIRTLENNCKVSVNTDTEKKNDSDPFMMDDLFKAIDLAIKPPKCLKTINFKSFTKRRVYYTLIEYDNGSFVCSCPAFKYSENKRCKHTKKHKNLFKKNKSY